MDKEQSITIDLKPLSLIIEDGDKFLFDPKAEDVLLKWKEFLKRVDEVGEQIKARLKAEMTAQNCVKVDGDQVVVTRRLYGERFEVTDKEAALASGFATERRIVKANSKEVDRYAKDVGELPEGIALKDRTEHVVIQVRGETEDHENG